MDKEKLRQELEQIKILITQIEGCVVLQEEIIADQLAHDFDTTLAQKIVGSYTRSVKRLQNIRAMILELLHEE